jgi:16S rRNA (guanine527-N7)-methyltransferase
MLREYLSELFAAWELEYDPSALDKFELYCSLLTEWNGKMNLTSITDEKEIAERSILDSLSLVKMGLKPGSRLIDIGSGAGFPGIPVKILRPDIELTLLDSQRKKTDFLTLVCGELDLIGCEVRLSRAEDLARAPGYREAFDYAVSRAVSRMNMLSELCIPFIKMEGEFLAMKTSHSSEEIEESGRAISKLGCKLAKSFLYTLPRSNITFQICRAVKEKKTPDAYPRKYSQIKKSPL